MALSYTNAQHTIPKSIEKEARAALDFYPELEATAIEFRFKKKTGKSTMQAQPIFWSLLKSKRKRKYVIRISEKTKITGKTYKTTEMDSDVLIGWFGHELGHIMDYEKRSGINLLWFGLKYSFSGKFIKKAERAADTYAVTAGMAEYILKTKRFILNNADIDFSYKERIQKYYLSPDEIMILVKESQKFTLIFFIARQQKFPIL